MGSIEAFLKDLDAAVGANADNQMVTQWIDTGNPLLNKVISGRYDGGLPYGRLLEMYGESSTGKTALATAWMVEAQRMGGVAGFVDWERSFNVEMARTFGLKDERPHWLYFKPKTWEEGNMKATKACQLIREAKIIPESAPILWVFDSIAAALPKSMAEKEISEYGMNDTTALARVTSTTLKAQAQWAEEFNATFLYLNQIRLKPGVVYGDPRTTPGGKAMEYYASARLALGRQKIMETKDGEKEFVGQQISVQCTKSKFTKPFKETNLRMSFNDDGVATFDMATSLLEYAIEHKLIPSGGPRCTWTDGKSYFKKALAAKINSEGLLPELRKIVAGGKGADSPATSEDELIV